MGSGQGALRLPHAVDAVESSRCGWPRTADGGSHDDRIPPLDDPVRMYLREVASLEPLSLGGEDELLIAIRRGDESARQRLTESNLWEVVRLARPFIGRVVSFLDLVQEGNLGLIRAVSEVPFEQESFN